MSSVSHMEFKLRAMHKLEASLKQAHHDAAYVGVTHMRAIHKLRQDVAKDIEDLQKDLILTRAQA